MCGIAGFVSNKRNGLDELADVLARTLVHRGPDDEGIKLLAPKSVEGRVVGLVNRRLAIIDPSPGGHQPMKDQETGNWITYNGEIYNFRALRSELEKRGASFRSQTDTEVILKSYAQEGIRALNRWCGMFAIGLWDSGREELLLAVDPLGIKPLYYWAASGAMLFASELRALLATGLVSRLIDPVALESYLSYGAIQAPHSMIRDVKALLPGTYMRIRADGFLDGPHRYWMPPFAPAGPPRPNQSTVVAELRQLLRDVVREHLISDVPLGACLSGGTDSSSIVALMHEVVPEAVHTFSVVFAEQEFSEALYAREVAQQYSAKHTEICLSEHDLLGMLPAALAAMDQPSVDGINVCVISRAIRDTGVTVALSGQGGDELFGGYPTFRRVARAQRWALLLRLAPRRARMGLARVWANAWRSVASDKLVQFISSNRDVLTTYLILRQLYPPGARRTLFPAGGQVSGENGLPAAFAEELRAAIRGLDVFNQVSFLELRTYLANMLLRDADAMSMAHSLELRVPFLDRRIVEFVARIPGPQKMGDGLPKPLLLQAMGDRLPECAYRRPKQGFTFPWEYWLRGRLRVDAEEALSRTDTFRELAMDPQAVRRLWQAFLDGRADVTWSRIWALVVLQRWAARHRAHL